MVGRRLLAEARGAAGQVFLLLRLIGPVEDPVPVRKAPVGGDDVPVQLGELRECREGGL